ncbi:hypothetical protein BUALT_Bualt15G0043400 [Buddleja alternifolia]|uniref:Cyclin-like domain-containing protein n=1 Tax=Buddleja alternifolia TaxID=168488 RepID=A0AAV6WDY3_9LAMI|nr:hypothetical protein BUALT_Bualt15G0043400 [Buddleja alternifolia]
MTMAVHQNAQKSLFDALYCEEQHEKWGDIEEEEEDQNDTEITLNDTDLSLFPLEQDLFYDDEELQSLFCKEKETCFDKTRFSLFVARKEAVEWILKINAHYGFSALTAILAVNYLDRFLTTLNYQKDHKQPWMMQLAAVTCLSLAAKVEETYVPLLLDLQEEVDECYELISETLSKSGNYSNPLKRKFWELDELYSCDNNSSNDSWGVESCISTSSSEYKSNFKKSRVQEQQMKLPSLSRVFVDALGSPH